MRQSPHDGEPETILAEPVAAEYFVAPMPAQEDRRMITGITDENLPLAVQLTSAPHEEEKLLQIGGWCESVFGFNEAPA